MAFRGLIPFTSDRRDFLKAGAFGAGALALGASAADEAGKEKPAIKIALIGCGGRGTGAAAQALEANPNAIIYALADYFEDSVNNAANQFAGFAKQRPKQIDIGDRKFSGLDAFQKAIDSGCDLVILATPPGFRPPHFEYAVKQGKHVFMEKPVAVDAPGIRQVLAAAEEAKKKNLYVAVGLQRHHQHNYIETLEKIKSGEFGKIVSGNVHWVDSGVWTRDQQGSEFEFQMRNWYYFNWLCGDQIAEQHIHNLDVFNWFIGSNPIKARGVGGRQVRTGQKKFGEIYDHFAVQYTYANGVILNSYCRHHPNCWSDVSEQIVTEKAMIDASGRISDHDGKQLWKFKPSTPDAVESTKKGGHAYEWVDLMNNLAAGKILNEGEYGAHSTLTSILGRTAVYSGQEITWDTMLKSEFRYHDPAVVARKETLVMPGADGLYPIAIPGVTKCF